MNNYLQYKPKTWKINTQTVPLCVEKIKISKNYLLNKSEPGTKTKYAKLKTTYNYSQKKGTGKIMITIQQKEDKFVMCKHTAFKIYINTNLDIYTISNIIAIKTDTEYIFPKLSSACFAMETDAPPMKTEFKNRTQAQSTNPNLT